MRSRKVMTNGSLTPQFPQPSREMDKGGESDRKDRRHPNRIGDRVSYRCHSWLILVLLCFGTIIIRDLYQICKMYSQPWRPILSNNNLTDTAKLLAPIIRPRMIALYEELPGTGYARTVLLVDDVQPIDTFSKHTWNREVAPLGNPMRENKIANSKDYLDLNEVDASLHDDCALQYEWQTRSFPNCNILHEFDLTTPFDQWDENRTRYQYLTHGFYRDVLSTLDDVGVEIIFKPIRLRHDFTYRNLDRMRRDSLVMERLTGQKYVLDIYAFCGTSGLFEFANGGDITKALWPSKGGSFTPLTQLEKLHIATQASMALASVHNCDKEGQASIAHTDISPGQFIKVNGRYKLNDFNRARFIRYRRSNGTQCTFQVGSNAGKNRSPEEYKYAGETEMVDVYSLGNVFYMLLQGEWPFADLKQDEAADKVMQGIRPAVYEDLWNSTDPVDMALKEAMIICHAQDPKERPTARELENYFRKIMRDIDPGRLEDWADA